jgi:uncharacterized membrane protein YciS (DUF1049 family)
MPETDAGMISHLRAALAVSPECRPGHPSSFQRDKPRVITMKPQSLQQRPRAILRMLQRGFSNTLTPKEETVLFLGVAATFVISLIASATMVYPALLTFDRLYPEWEGRLTYVLAITFGLGAAVGGVVAMLWSTGRDLRCRGGLGGTPPGANPPATLPE